MRIEQVYKQEQMKKKLVALEYIRLDITVGVV